MKFLSIPLVMMVFGVSVAQANYSAEVGVQAIARSVVEKKLVQRNARAIILLALETGKAGLGKGGPYSRG